MVQKRLCISAHASVDWRSFCCEVCENWLQFQEPIGGEGLIVEINETLLVRWKQNVGRILSQVWKFGGTERVSKKSFLLPVMDDDANVPVPCSKEILVLLIKKFIRPSTTVCSDSWRAYNSLEEEGYRHWCVNHSISFIDPQSKDIHIQNVERLWRDVKEYIKRPEISAKYLLQYIVRYIFLKHRCDNAIHLFLLEAAKLYPTLSDRVCLSCPPSSGESDATHISNFDEPRPSTLSQLGRLWIRSLFQWCYVHFYNFILLNDISWVTVSGYVLVTPLFGLLIFGP